MTEIVKPNATGFSFGATLADVVGAYSEWLQVKHPDTAALFKYRLAADPQAAQAEAAIFSLLRGAQLKPTLLENPSTGGPDFECKPNGQPFCIEVTSLKAEAMTKKSSLPDHHNIMQSFSLVTQELCDAAKGKVSQLSKYKGPRVLVIALSHANASLLLSPIAATWLLVSEPKIHVPIHDPNKPDSGMTNVTDLKSSVFIKPDKENPGSIIPCRQSISALLLADISEREVSMLGVLHPDPVHPFDIWNFSDVHFVRLRWPVVDGHLTTEWVVADPNPSRFPHQKVSFTYQELTQDS